MSNFLRTEASELPLVLQRDRNECALACLAMLARWYGLRHTLESIRYLHIPSDEGMTLNSLASIAAEIGFEVAARWCSPCDLIALTQPCVLHWRCNHYVVLWTIVMRDNVPNYAISDPARGRQMLAPSAMSKYFSGVAVNLSLSSKRDFPEML